MKAVSNVAVDGQFLAMNHVFNVRKCSVGRRRSGLQRCVMDISWMLDSAKFRLVGCRPGIL